MEVGGGSGIIAGRPDVLKDSRAAEAKAELKKLESPARVVVRRLWQSAGPAEGGFPRDPFEYLFPDFPPGQRDLVFGVNGIVTLPGGGKVAVEAERLYLNIQPPEEVVRRALEGGFGGAKSAEVIDAYVGTFSLSASLLTVLAWGRPKGADSFGHLDVAMLNGLFVQGGRYSEKQVWEIKALADLLNKLSDSNLRLVPLFGPRVMKIEY